MVRLKVSKNKQKHRMERDIHKIEDLFIKGKRIEDAKLVFFDKKDEQRYNPFYKKLIEETPNLTRPLKPLTHWYFRDTHGNEYRIRKSILQIKDIDGGKTATIESGKEYLLLSQYFFRIFLENNGYPKDTKISNEFVKENIIKKRNFSIFAIEKTGRISVVWSTKSILKQTMNQYVAILVINNEILGYVTCEIWDEKEIKDCFEGDHSVYPNMNKAVYISYVKIHPDFQGRGYCRPLVSFTIKQLRKLGYEMLHIENASRTARIEGEEGIPACICYYRAGIDNNYKMRYFDKVTNSFKIMYEKNCLEDRPLPNEYYYISDDIPKRGREILQRVGKRLVKSRKLAKDAVKEFERRTKK